MNRNDWSKWLMDIYGNYPGAGQIDYLKKEVKTVKAELSRIDLEDATQAGEVIAAAMSLISELWDGIGQSLDFAEACDSESAVIREALATRLVEAGAYPIGAEALTEVRAWTREHIDDYEWTAYGHGAYLIVNNDPEKVLFKLRWADELKLK